jgi:hypothetical protein
MNNILERTWKEAVGPNLRYYPEVFLKGLGKQRKTSFTTVGLRAEI